MNMVIICENVDFINERNKKLKKITEINCILTIYIPQLIHMKERFEPWKEKIRSINSNVFALLLKSMSETRYFIIIENFISFCNHVYTYIVTPLPKGLI